jgi:uncharacterized membrane protein
MNKSNIFSISKPKSYFKVLIWVFLILFSGKFIIKDALPYFGFEQETYGHYWDYKWPLIGHISCGLLALVLGPFQFWKSFRNKYLTVHRWSGRIYLTAILIGTISSTSLAWTSAIRVNFAWAFGLQGLAFAWIATASMAYISVMRGRILQHKEWMIRSYVVTFAFVTFRWLNELTFVKNMMPEFEERGPTIIWLSWTIPLLITEIVLSWKKKQ